MKSPPSWPEAELTFYPANGSPARNTATAQEDELSDVLRAFQDAVFRHPIAIQGLFAALVREGREYAKTEEGATLLARLSKSPSLAKTRMVWEVLTLSAFVEEPEGASHRKGPRAERAAGHAQPAHAELR